MAKAIGSLAFKNRGLAPDLEPVLDLDERLRDFGGYVKTAFNRSVIYYRSADPRAHSGFYLLNQTGVVLVNADSEDPHRGLIGNELLYALRHANSGAYLLQRASAILL